MVTKLMKRSLLEIAVVMFLSVIFWYIELHLQNIYISSSITLQKRRDDHKTPLFLKMKSNLVPRYLSSLVPPTVESASRYSLRNADNIQNINTKTALYSNSFLPSAVRNWNDLPCEAKQIDSINSFKYFLARERERAPVYYYTGKRLCQILHTRLRTNCSNLNYYLFSKHLPISCYNSYPSVVWWSHFIACRKHSHIW